MLHPNEPLELLRERQKELENHAMRLGAERFRKKLEDSIKNGSEASVGAAKRLLVDGLDKVEAAMKELSEAGGKGRPHAAIKWIKLLGTDVAAYLALKVVLDHIHGRVSMRKAVREVNDLILDELRYRRFAEKEPKLFEYAMNGFTTSSYAHKARNLDVRIHRAKVDVSDLDMAQSEAQAVGVKFIDIVIETTQLSMVERHREASERGVEDRVELVATEETLKWLKAGNDKLVQMYPVNLPMIMPPVPWKQGHRGGYRFGLRGKHRIVRTNDRAARKRIDEAHMPLVYEALNRIQETPWRINVRVAEVMDQLLVAGGGIAKLPSVNDEEMPAKPVDIDTNEEARKEWRKRAHAVHERNHEQRSKRADIFRMQAIINLVKNEGAIWFPHNLDFRGRVYPVTSYLHPQGDDLCKSLLVFSEGKPLGESGVRFLAIHGANALGKARDGRKLSKQTLDDRVEYIKTEAEAICAVAEDPIANRWWTTADEPWQFLSFCFEWAGYLRDGVDYECAMPVAMDGTCNGLQHYAALLQDQVGGAAVNLVPAERPQDIYQNVADVVMKRLEVEALKNPLAVMWLRSGLLDRKLTKKNVMTFGYGSQKFGFSQQLRDFVEEKVAEAEAKKQGDGMERVLQHFIEVEIDPETQQPVAKNYVHKACTYMATLIWDSLEVTAASAFNGMAWFRECAKIISKQTKQLVEWTVPGTGLLVTQAYVEEKLKRTNTMLAGSAFRPALWEHTNTPNWKKHSSSMPPNVVHSLDAAALMLTVISASTQGITCFGMIHDSYSTLPGDAALLARATRQAFFRLYSEQDVVGELHMQMLKMVDGKLDEDGKQIELPAPPPKGALDISKVLLSDYFFS